MSGVVLGFGPESRSRSGLNLAARLARSTDDSLVLCCVVQDSYDTPTLRDGHDVGAEWRTYLTETAREAIAEARAELPDDVAVTEVVRSGRSVPAALAEEGARRGADLLVVGSASVGSVGRISLGSTSDRLVHSSQVPVALAPRGYPVGDRLTRIVLAVEPTRGDVALAPKVRALAERLGAEIEVVTFGVRPSRRSALGALADQGVYDAWRAQVRETHDEVRAALSSGDHPVPVSGAGLVTGERWSSALDGVEWADGDLLVVGSSRHSQVASVFLGSTATRILRHSPVPAVVLPRR
ncbi:universal stress protein [Marmoricola endophyticus]|uniref:Universal stress protein n=1 Tax=Marmoricola endophyticus TaxID=2040280 RepID=A0A917F5G0_9ACTN|nr:universal stress protein [Marmoricola endophyticus]GGF45264.1 universal stress protein [Marmoricola endophyticus]